MLYAKLPNSLFSLPCQEGRYTPGKYIAGSCTVSEEFRERLKAWEPWRLDERSVQEGKNLYVNVTKGYASARTLELFSQVAKGLSLSEDELWAGIIETVRKVEWEAIKVMAEKGIATTYTLPHLVLGREPHVDVIAFHNALKVSRGKKGHWGDNTNSSSLLFSKEEAEQKLYIQTRQRLLGSKQLYERSYHEAIPIAVGSNLYDVIGLHEERVKSLLNNGSEDQHNAIVTIVEEEVHHQKYRDQELRQKLKLIAFEDRIFPRNIIESNAAGQRAEKELGIKDLIQEVSREVEKLPDLFLPLARRLPRTRQEGGNNPYDKLV